MRAVDVCSVGDGRQCEGRPGRVNCGRGVGSGASVSLRSELDGRRETHEAVRKEERTVLAFVQATIRRLPVISPPREIPP